ncbi:related to galactinol synthase [Phialocephala subalpina]|uniref:Related to galactinol synthase n=1 Tax=Phialocephala subalpina TaxID=576137 RepID=A0A1L7XXK3_9HELO|nr:related to galactinol synthase [Phialocephala subalpina]
MNDTPNPPSSPFAWVTLLTRTSYLPGVVLLAYSLHRHASKYPLLILTTPSFPSSLLPTLEHECSLVNAAILPITPLSPPPSNTPSSLIASRFEDTWTKLRVFSLHRCGYEKLVFLDADMLVMRNLDELFDYELPGRDWIAANHACVCNLDKDSWAPGDWVKENCAYTGLRPGDAPTPRDVRLHPYEEQWDAMLEFLNSNPLVKTFLFPDQDFLAEFFKGRWKSVGWQYNALKTMRYWHEEMWEDGEVRNPHYIVDKPWSRRVGSDGVAGYLGRDGVTHGWWWGCYERWERERENRGEKEVLEMVRMEVAKPLEEGKEAEALHGNWQSNPGNKVGTTGISGKNVSVQT